MADGKSHYTLREENNHKKFLAQLGECCLWKPVSLFRAEEGDSGDTQQ